MPSYQKDIETGFVNLHRLGKEQKDRNPERWRNIMLYLRQRAPANGLESLAEEAVESLEKQDSGETRSGSGAGCGSLDDSIYRNLDLTLNSDEYDMIYEIAESLKNDYLENLTRGSGEVGKNLFGLAFAKELFVYLESVPEEKLMKRGSSDLIDETFMGSLKAEEAARLKKEFGKNRSYLEALISFREAVNDHFSYAEVFTVEDSLDGSIKRVIPIIKEIHLQEAVFGDFRGPEFPEPYDSVSRNALIRGLDILTKASSEIGKEIPLYQNVIETCNDAEKLYPDFVPEHKIAGKDGVESASNFKEIAERNLSDILKRLPVIDREISEISFYLR